jgi:hypothetical protein
MQAGVDSGRNLGTAQATKNPTAAASGTFNSASGAGEYSSLGEPANGGVSGGKASNAYPYKVDCNVTRTKYLGGIGVKYGTCVLDASANVAAVPFSVCTKSQAGGICGTSDWSSYQTVNKGGSATFAGGKAVIKLTACTYSTCEASLVDNDQASGEGDTLNAQGQAKAVAEGPDSLTGQQAGVYDGALYHSALQSAGSEASCYNTNSQSLEAKGEVKTCDGKQTASLNPGCQTVTECLAQNTTTKTWTETCEAEVPLTTKTCTTTTPTLDCDGSLAKQQVTCSNALTVTCLANSNVVPAKPVSGSAWWCDTCASRPYDFGNVFSSVATQAGNTVAHSVSGSTYTWVATGGSPVSVGLNAYGNVGTGRTFVYQLGKGLSLSIDGAKGYKSGKPMVYFSAVAGCENKVYMPATKDHPGHWYCPNTSGLSCPAGSTLTVINGNTTCLGAFTYDCTDAWNDGCTQYKQ